MALGLSRLTPNRWCSGPGPAAANATGLIYTVSGLKAGSTAILYADGVQVSSVTADGTGKATWTLGVAPGAGSIMTYDGVVVGSAGTVPQAQFSDFDGSSLQDTDGSLMQDAA